MLPLPQENTPSSWASSRIKHEIQPFCLGSKPLPYLLQSKIKIMFISSKSLETNKKSNLFGIKFCRRESSSFDRLAHFKMCFLLNLSQSCFLSLSNRSQFKEYSS